MADPRTAASSFGPGRKSNGRIGDFEIGSEIGKGSFAKVYYGWHKVRASFLLSGLVFDPFPTLRLFGIVLSDVMEAALSIELPYLSP
jgi:hypothetical protein